MRAARAQSYAAQSLIITSVLTFAGISTNKSRARIARRELAGNVENIFL